MLERREFLRAVLAGAVGTTFTYSSAEASRFAIGAQNAQPPITATKLADSLVMLSGDGGNVAIVIGADGLLMIDGGLAERSVDLLKAVADVDGRKVTTLFNTHWHYDHVGSNEALGRTGTKIVAHENVKKRLSQRTAFESANRTFDPLKPEGLPKETFTTGTKTFVGRTGLIANHIPLAHTDGDAYVFFPSLNVLHTGDLLFNGTYPVIDYSTGGWIGGMAQAAAKLADVGDANTKIIPGHGPLATKADLKASHDMLAAIHDRVAALIKQGKTVEEAVAAKPSKEFDAKFGQGARKPDAFVQVAYTSIQRHGA
ncbi:MAG TPA: MBL fold metallo-hydrolase [Vicinamibacterales bacterium]|nr:MBL fold metallo-hydrolase [Vicinamibacterales bacterium]